MGLKNNNREALTSFIRYCENNPEQRFWQALRNWNKEQNPNENFIFIGEVNEGSMKFYDNLKDTFFRV